MLHNLDGGLLFNSLLSDDDNLTNFSSRDTTLNNILTNSRQDPPWRMSDEIAEKFVPRRSSIKLNFLKSALQIEEERTKESRKRRTDAQIDFSDDKSDTTSNPIPDAPWGIRDEVEERKKRRNDDKIDFSDDDGNSSLYIFRKKEREQYGAAKGLTSKTPAKVAEATEASEDSSCDSDEDPSAFVRYSKDLIEQSEDQNSSDNTFHEEELNDIYYHRVERRQVSEVNAHTPAKFADLETNRCRERLAKIGEVKSKKSSNIMQFQMIQSVIGGEFFFIIIIICFSCR